MGGFCSEEDIQPGKVRVALAKYDSSGNLKWDRYWDEGQRSYCTDLTADSSGNIYLTGFVGKYHTSLAKYDSSGVLKWDKEWKLGTGKAIALDSLKNIYIVGVTTRADAFLFKLDNQGTPFFNVTWGDQYTLDYGSAIGIDSSDSIFIAQNSKDLPPLGPFIPPTPSDANSGDTGEDFYLIKIINVPDAATIPGFDILFIIGLIYIVSGIIIGRYRKLI